MNAKLAINLREKKLGLLIRDARQSAGKTKKECGASFGASSGAMGSIETGVKSPSLPEIELLAYYLDVPLEHFWLDKIRSNQTSLTNDIHVEHTLSLRNRSIGELLTNMREEKSITMKELSQNIGISPARLKKFESGNIPVPLPYLEALCNYYDIEIKSFLDKSTIIGKWIVEQKSIEDFLLLSPELQDFVSKSANQSYIAIAKILSETSAEKLRAIAEGLLEITL
jgi:transcriptional regulator with XRE-family HTH domain